ncbi:oligopeptide/dipeptide ABC transporter ATP-binding protein [Streptomyces sp. NPDC001351]|uniref:oligopeptide/dipeptide ABC transporter ATP-binding protein n=1 Tax=Streptomyces sp. NPDC001351 TaxID=3364564 RepID=UPI0036C0949A
MVRHVSYRIAVMHLGEIVELADTEALFTASAHPYAQALLSAVPDIDDGTQTSSREGIVPTGEVPHPVDKPSGRPYRTRCRYAQEICSTQRPRLTATALGRLAACHFPLAG